jgi:CDP-6-deoxy-D-xylo-4-hexulose-3-dehydrase
VGELPYGYDHKYCYSHVGYNLKVSDMQAAVGLSQLEKLDEFVRRRRENFDSLTARIKNAGLDRYFILPEATPDTNPSWFGYLLTLKDGLGITRREITAELEQRKIGTRLLFAGNITKQPAFREVEYRIAGSLSKTDKVMADSFWVGVWPGLSDRHLDYIVDKIVEIIRNRGV